MYTDSNNKIRYSQRFLLLISPLNLDLSLKHIFSSKVSSCRRRSLYYYYYSFLLNNFYDVERVFLLYVNGKTIL